MLFMVNDVIFNTNCTKSCLLGMQMDFDIPSISAIVAAAGVLIGVIYYVLDMRNQTRIRKTDQLTRLYSTGTSKEFIDAFWKVVSLQVKDYQDYVKQYGSLLTTDSTMNRAFYTVSSYYELVGVLLYRKLIDLVTVYDVWGSSGPIMLFEKMKPVLLGIRREIEPGAFIGFEYLCHELKRAEPQMKKTVNEVLGKIQSQTTLSS
jgi:hypothetical protein